MWPMSRFGAFPRRGRVLPQRDPGREPRRGCWCDRPCLAAPPASPIACNGRHPAPGRRGKKRVSIPAAGDATEWTRIQGSSTETADTRDGKDPWCGHSIQTYQQSDTFRPKPAGSISNTSRISVHHEADQQNYAQHNPPFAMQPARETQTQTPWQDARKEVLYTRQNNGPKAEAQSHPTLKPSV